MEISEIKQRLSIQTVLSHYNLQPDRHNFIKCPFHGDEDPSLKIYPETGTFNCFGCGAAGDVIEFIERHDKRGKHEAILKAKSMIDPSAGIIQRAMIQTNEPENDKELLPRRAVMGKLMQESRAVSRERQLQRSISGAVDWTRIKPGPVTWAGTLEKAGTRGCSKAQ